MVEASLTAGKEPRAQLTGKASRFSLRLNAELQKPSGKYILFSSPWQAFERVNFRDLEQPFPVLKKD